MKRLHALDTLRGVAALSIVFWHWQHFFAISGDWQEGWSRTQEPFYPFLKPLYEEGWAAVDLFFVLSGFVFFWLYGARIREARIGAARFALLRFSRLYPLHFVLLIAVAAMQFAFFRANDGFFVYDVNDVPHFIAQLFLVQNWYPWAPQSFNGPAWSVSLECLLYAVFFIACRFGLRAGWRSVLLALCGVPLLWIDEHIARGVIGFFMGGAMVACWRSLRAHANAAAITRVLGWGAIAGWAVLAGIAPDLDKAGRDVALKYTFGDGNTGMHREAYCAGWIVMGKLLRSGWTPAGLARIPESSMVAAVRAALAAK